jgi:hypothetical protein
MPKFSQKYSDAQREAIVTAVVDRGMKVLAAVKAAAAGELAGVDAFDMAEGTAYSITREARLERRTPEDILDKVLTAAPVLLEREYKRLAGKDELTAGDLASLRTITKTASELRSVRQNGHDPSDADPSETSEAPTQETTKDRLRRRLEEEREEEAAPAEESPVPCDEEPREPDPSHTHAPSTTHTENGGSPRPSYAALRNTNDH